MTTYTRTPVDELADAVAAEIAELAERADLHYGRCKTCRGRLPCDIWAGYYRQILLIGGR